MIPKIDNDGLELDFEEVAEPSRTFRMQYDKGRCFGFTDELEAMKQAIFLMLSIERYDYPILSWNVGFEIKDLFGKPTSYVVSEVKRRIEECLLQDERITAVDGFETSTIKNKVHVKFVAHTIYGDVEAEREVNY